MSTEEIKKCISCLGWNSLSDYYFNPSDKEYYNQCKECCLDNNVKQCSTCKKVKPFLEYYYRKNEPRSECKDCCSMYSQKWVENNHEYHAQQMKEYYNRSEIKEYRKESQKEYQSRSEIKEHKKEYDKEYRNRPDVKKHRKEYGKEYLNRIEVKEHRKEYHKNKYQSDINFRIKMILRSRLKTALNENTKSDTTLNLLGCDLEFFRSWIEYQFDVNMTFQNHGEYWHYDHVKPCSSFDFSKELDQRDCFNWKNIRPLYGLDNISKGDKYDTKLKFLHEIVLKSFIINNKITQYLN